MSCARNWPRKESDCPSSAAMRRRRTGNTPSTSHWAVTAHEDAAHNLAWAEYFHYIGPEGSDWDKYVAENAVPL